MIRKTVSVLLIVLITLSCLCFPAQANEKPLRIWFSHIEEENEALRKIAGEFTLKTGIKVEVIGRRAIFDAPADLVNYATLPNRPDIVFMQAPDIGGLVRSGYLQPLEFDNDIKSRFLQTAFDAFTLEGKCYGVGYSIDTSGLIYNKNLISKDELPKTWDEFFAVSEELTIKDNSGNIVQRGTLLNSRDMWFTYPIIREYGGYYFGKYSDGTYNAYDVGLDNVGMLLYVEKMKELMDKDLVLKSQVAGESNIVGEFGSGRVAMILYGLWSAKYFKDMGINYGIAMLPNHKDGSVSKPFATVQGFIINRYTEDLDGAKAFLNFILEDKNQQMLIEAGNGGNLKTGQRNPSNISVINSDYIKNDEILKSLSHIGEFSEPFPNIPEGTIWYNYTPTSFRTIFFDDFDPGLKLKELADTIRRDVALMNYKAERIEIKWWVYVILCFSLLVLIALIVFSKIYRNRKNPLYVRYEFKKRTTVLSWFLMMPMLVLLCMFYLYPIIHNVYLSLTDYSGINLKDYGLIGFSNYKDIFVSGIDGLVSMISWTIVFAISVVTFSFILGTFIATVLDRVNIQIAKGYRVIFILPWVIPTVITLLMWQGLLETDGGLVNQILNLVGIPSVPWLSRPGWARVSTILVMTWFSFPYFMVVAFGMLKSIPKDYYEAARMDGAGNAKIFARITLPLVFKAVIPILIMSFIMQFNQFGVYLLTGGGPPSETLGAPGSTDLLITYVFNRAFNTKRFAQAAAYSVVIFIFVSLFALIAMKINKKRTEVK